MIDTAGGRAPYKHTTLEASVATTIVAAMQRHGVRRLVVTSMVAEGDRAANTPFYVKILLATFLRRDVYPFKESPRHIDFEEGPSIMAATWSPEQLERIGTADELQIASRGADGTLRRWTLIWVVSVNEQVYVRTWYRRESGWFGHVLDSHRARIRVPGLEADVTVEDAGAGLADLRTDIDAAYRAKYGRYGRTSVEAMVSAAAAAATLRLSPDPDPEPSGSGRAGP